ncbi:MAG: DUF3810 domain-containing protein [Firmicutes bacterium]|nr:DUF3810 domain-containing protein [Bacillota bacterium]
MKYIRGYLVAAACLAITWLVTQFAASHTVLVDMFYPYVSRMLQTTLAEWSSALPFCLWQLLAITGVMILLATVVAMIVLKWNFFQWLGWVLSAAAMLWMLHTGIYGLNSYAGDLSDDIRLTMSDYTVTELALATEYYRDMANSLAVQLARDSAGDPVYPDFDTLAQECGEGFETLKYDYQYAVFAGSTLPVKQLGWTELYESMGITGVTMPLTGEAAVDPNIPAVSLPFTMCHEMAHRMCIAYERDANFAGFLACSVHSDPYIQYSGYFMAFRYCYNALASVSTSTARAAAQEIYAGVCDELLHDLTAYRSYWSAAIDESANEVATTVNNAYIQASGDESGVSSYDEVYDMLVCWYIQEIYAPAHTEEEAKFDPLDKTQVDVG